MALVKCSNACTASPQPPLAHLYECLCSHANMNWIWTIVDPQTVRDVRRRSRDHMARSMVLAAGPNLCIKRVPPEPRPGVDMLVEMHGKGFALPLSDLDSRETPKTGKHQTAITHTYTHTTPSEDCDPKRRANYGIVISSSSSGSRVLMSSLPLLWVHNVRTKNETAVPRPEEMLKRDEKIGSDRPTRAAVGTHLCNISRSGLCLR